MFAPPGENRLRPMSEIQNLALISASLATANRRRPRSCGTGEMFSYHLIRRGQWEIVSNIPPQATDRKSQAPGNPLN